MARTAAIDAHIETAIDTESDTAYTFTSLDSLVCAVSDWTAELPTRRRIHVGQRLGSFGDAIRTAAASELVGDDGDTGAAQRALGGQKTSKRVARRVAKRATAAAKNAKIGDGMASGALSGEQVDALVAADRRTDGAATGDDDLVDAVSAASADGTAKIIDDYVTANADADSVQAEHDRQRKLRSVNKHRGRFGLSALTIEGDDPSIDAIYKQIRSDANRLYQLDGGRDVAAGAHRRTNDQRLFDALWARLTGNASPIDKLDADGEPVHADNSSPDDPSPDDPSPDDPSPDDFSPDDFSPDDFSSDGSKRDDGDPKRPVQSRRYTPAARRPTVVIVAALDKLVGGDPNLVAEQIGVGPIADSVLAAYLANTQVGVDLIGAVFGTDGQPLWLGRRARLASDAQYLALVIRDKHCTLCDAPYDQCQAHHLTPWHAPAAGDTDIDKLALLCDPCHHRLHDHNLTLYQNPNTGHWNTRPATPAETPPPRPPPTRRPQPRQPRPASGTPNSPSTKSKPQTRKRAA